MLQTLQNLPVWCAQREQPLPPTAAKEINYFENHRAHIHYAERAAEGCPVGSGAMESLCGQLLAWATKERGEVSANYFNNMLSFLRQVFAAAIADHKERTGVLIANPAMGIKRTPKRRRPTLDLPDTALFDKILETIRQRGSRQAEDCIDLAEFLAYSGARVYSEAA